MHRLSLIIVVWIFLDHVCLPARSRYSRQIRTFHKTNTRQYFRVETEAELIQVHLIRVLPDSKEGLREVS